MEPEIAAFFDEATNLVTYLVTDPATNAAAVIDLVLNFDPKAARTSTASAERLIEAVRQKGLRVEWLLETHVHADHLSAAQHLKQRLECQIGISEHIRDVQAD